MSENPYLPPQTNVETSPSQPRHPGQGSPYGPYRNTSGIAAVLVTLFGILFLCSLTFLYFNWNELQTLQDRNFNYESAEYEASFSLWTTITAIYGAVSLIIIILWCVWANKSCKNAWLINSRDGAAAVYRGRESFTPGWTVGWYFIPIASLWKPFQAMAWIRDASQKPLGLTMGKLLGLWWTFWILSQITDLVATVMKKNDGTAEELATYYRTIIVLVPIDFVSIIFAALVVHRLTRIQKIRARELGLILYQ